MAGSINSCGTPSCLSTETSSNTPTSPDIETVPDTPSNSMQMPSDGAALLRELDSLRCRLADQALSGMHEHSVPEGGPLLVLGRFATGLEPSAQASLLREIEHSSDWFALELDPEQYPQVRILCEHGTPLRECLCFVTGTLRPAAFLQQIDGAMRRSRASGSELALMTLEVMLPETETDPDRYIWTLSRLARMHERLCDIPARLDVTRLGVLLPGSGPFRARALAERIIADFELAISEWGIAETVTVRAGIACCGDDGCTAETWLQQSGKALEQALPGHTRTYREADAPERRTQVHACEKQFLFFGEME